MELKHYLDLIRNKLGLLLGIVAIATAGTGICTALLISPSYEASTKLIVNQSRAYGDGIQTIDWNSVNTNVMLINSYKEIIKSTAIMEKVASRFPNLGVTADELIDSVTVSSANDSQVMTLSVVEDSYVKAARLANTISTVFKEEIPKIMNVDNVTILNEAKVDGDKGPISPNLFLNVSISLVISLIFGVGLIWLLDYLNDSIADEAQVEQVLKLPTLAVIGRIREGDPKSNLYVTPKPSLLAGEKSYVEAK
ncbi:chain length determinant protein [Cohnella sp. CFH 77786]|uniref:YveK family protein n=1 Tax=Cohnella sp. CFH 77786 TaxID=2662265 RepID=UPI001C60F3DC|nr:chain length determinant protein [Cohnella sp. CFH 77786]